MQLDLPESFHDLDLQLDPEADRLTVEIGVDAHLDGVGLADNPPVRDRFVARAQATLAEARRRGARAAALALIGHDGMPVEAYVLLFCVEGSDATDPMALDELAESLTRGTRHDVGRQTASIIDLDGRPAVRAAGFAALDPDADHTAIVAVRQYWVPVPGTGTQYVLWAWTPDLHALDHASNLFDTVARGMVIDGRRSPARTSYG